MQLPIAFYYYGKNTKFSQQVHLNHVLIWPGFEKWAVHVAYLTERPNEIRTEHMDGAIEHMPAYSHTHTHTLRYGNSFGPGKNKDK